MIDEAARQQAVDPARNIVLEASAGTGKTRVLVERYVNLLGAGVEPAHILAITFTRKAAAEMRDRVVDRLRELSRLSQPGLVLWRDLRQRLWDVTISTIDAFCVSLLREFPLEADVDPGFELADDAEVPRLVEEALDRSLRICRARAREDDDIALLFADLGERRLRVGLAKLLDRRLIAARVLGRVLANGPRDLTADVACQRAMERLRGVLQSVKGGLQVFLASGPVHHPQFSMFADDLRSFCASTDVSAAGSREGQAHFRALLDRVRAYFLTQDGRPRGKAFTGTAFNAGDCGSADAWRRHRELASSLAPEIAELVRAFRRDLNVVLSRGVWRVFGITTAQYQRTLESRALLDFPAVLERASALLANMEEFAQSRFKLEARYRHVLVDEFQDTSRAQWQLVAELIRSWGEGLGAASDSISPSIFIVGDRKQSIYGFRDADASILDEAATFVGGLRGGDTPRRAISVSFRSHPSILAFVNDLFAAIASAGGANGAAMRRDAFRYEPHDRFPVLEEEHVQEPNRLGLLVGATVGDTADAVAEEISELLAHATVRDRMTGVARRAQPSDIAVLFRSRDSHREFEKAIARTGVGTYVYKGLGFFEADEVQDAVAVLRYLAHPLSNLRAAALLRSRIVRLSDRGVAALAPGIASAILSGASERRSSLDDADERALNLLRRDVQKWLSWVDHLTPAELLARVLAETGYAYETRGRGRAQARENLKKLAAMVRRFQNRGYVTLPRLADHLEELALGDEANASIDANGAVSLMTAHAAKGLEFPIVFVVNMGRGTGGVRPPIRVTPDWDDGGSVSVADFQSEADEDAQARDREESKRLLYVALTRARDRLYLSAIVPNGVCRMGRGSLGEILPASFKSVFGEVAAGGVDAVTWSDANGRPHQFAVRRTLNVEP